MRKRGVTWLAAVLGTVVCAAVVLATFAHSEPPPPGPPAGGGPSTGARYPVYSTHFVTRYPEGKWDIPPSLEQLNKPRPYDLDPKLGIFVDDFVLWTLDDFGNHFPEHQEFVRLTGRQLVNGDYHLVIHIRDAPELNDLFFYVRYHPEEFHPRQIMPGSAFGLEGDRLWFSKLDVPGIVCAGMTRVRPDKDGGTTLTDGVICEITFVNKPFEHKPRWLEHAPDGIRNKPTGFTAYEEPETGCTVLYWEETNVGDLNNDGEVSLVDLIPIGRRYGRISTDGSEDAWDWFADANHDGEVNYKDTWKLDPNYGALLSGYRVYRREKGQPRRKEILLTHNTGPVLPMSIHRPRDWNPAKNNVYRYFDRTLPISTRAKEWVYRIVPYNAVDDIEGENSALEVTIRVSKTALTVRPSR